MRGFVLSLLLIIPASLAQSYDQKTIFLIGDYSSWMLDSMPDGCGTLEAMCARSAIAIYTDSDGNKMFDLYGQNYNANGDNNFAGIGCKLITQSEQTEYRISVKAGNCRSRSGTGYKFADVTINRASLKDQRIILQQTFTIGSATDFRKIKNKVNKKIASTELKI